MSHQVAGRGSMWGGGGGRESAHRYLGEGAGIGSGEGRWVGWGMPKGGEHVGGGKGGAQHCGPRGRSGLQVPILCKCRFPRVYPNWGIVTETLYQPPLAAI